MDTISFLIRKAKKIENSKFTSFEIDVVINGQILPGLIGSDVFSAYKFQHAEFNLFTCSCGVPECSGYFELVKQVHKENTVEWTIPLDSYKNCPKSNFNFDKFDFLSSFKKIINEIENLEKENCFLHFCFDDISMEFDEKSKDPISLNEVISWNDTQFKFDEEIFHITTKKFPELANKDFNIGINDKISNYKVNVCELAFSILNHQPRHNFTSYYFKKFNHCLIAIKNMIETGDNTKILYLINKNYNLNNMTSNDFFERFIFEEDISFNPNSFKIIF